MEKEKELGEGIKREGATAKQRPTTHPSLGLLVGAGIDQQPHAVRATTRSSPNQRCKTAL